MSERNISQYIELIYHSTKRGAIVEIPKELESEYREFFKMKFKTQGNSARASAKRMFIRENIHRIHPEAYNSLKSYVSNLYSSGEGLKRIAKKLNVGYSPIRTIFGILGIEINKGQDVCYDKTRELRSNNLKNAYKNRTGWFTNLERRTSLNSRGVQGYYYNKVRAKYVWLRSTYEYIYAKWLDEKGIDWDIEQSTYKLSDGYYRPDFFIYENSKLVRVVEVKGYWDRNSKRRAEELSDQIGVDVVVLYDISSYSKSAYLKELKEWKIERLLEQK